MPIIGVLDLFEKNIRSEIRILDSLFGPFCEKIILSSSHKKVKSPNCKTIFQCAVYECLLFFEAVQHSNSWYFQIFRNRRNTILDGFCVEIVFSGLCDICTHLDVYMVWRQCTHLNVYTDVYKIDCVRICTHLDVYKIMICTHLNVYNSDLYTSGVHIRCVQNSVHIWMCTKWWSVHI
jgi:hypothetical protein